MSDAGDGPAPRTDPVDWVTARRVARLVAGRDAIHASYLSGSLADDFATVTAEAEGLVAEHTGLAPPGPARAEVLDRHGWVDANVVSMRRMLAPVTERVGERVAGSIVAPVGRHVAGTEIGVVVGLLAQRVLGQYDLLVPEDEVGRIAESDAVYYVGPNVLALEKRFAFRPVDFRRWIAIHELTHRGQFAGVPWMRAHFLGLVEESLSFVDPDPRVLVRALGRAAEAVRAGRNPLDGGGIVGLVASEEQRAVLDRVQALMALLEGHGNVVMDELGRRHVHGAARMAQVLHARRQTRGLVGAFHKAIGLELKLRQYEIGERFVRGVAREAGPRGIDAAWRGPAALPTLAELDDPAGWLARVDGLVDAHPGVREPSA